VRRLRTLSEAECYVRLYGASDDAVRVIWDDEPRVRAAVPAPLTGADVRRLFEPRVVHPSREAA
jgi:hypothetical protein